MWPPPSLLAPLHPKMSTPVRSYTPILLAYLAGLFTTYLLFAQPSIGIHPSSKFKRSVDLAARAEAWVGSTETHSYPPSRPTNYDPSLFPSDIGFAGPTPTGAEPALLATAPAYPLNSGNQGLLLVPDEFSNKHFELLKKWGNLSPWYSIPTGTFGVETGPGAPDGCTVTGLHFLHRHGARYPTGDGKLTQLPNTPGFKTDQTDPTLWLDSFLIYSRNLRRETASDWRKLDGNWKIGIFE